MSVHSSFSEQSYLKQFREEMERLKSPYLQKIKLSTQTFHTKMKIFQQKLNRTENADEEESQQEKKRKSIYQHRYMDSEENMNDKENQQVNPTTQQMEIEKMRLKSKKSQLPLQLMKEWTGNSYFSFNTMDQVKENFINVFNKKLGVTKKKKEIKCYDFKDDQKHMIFNIFHELQNQYGPDKGFVNIDRVIEFFQENQLFYLFYNIHPNQLKYVLKQSARTKANSLNKKEFLYVFIMDRPLLKDLSNPFEKVVHRKCILDQDGWQDLKAIFNTLDTFGNQTIHIKSFIQKLKNCHSNPNLIYTPVIQFPEIDRIYTLKKVIFDLEHKFQFEDKITWKDIQQLIYNFNHKEQPTLDIIFERHLEQATILLDSNYFLIEKRIISILKHVYEKCPKFSDFFVNTKFLCLELLQSQDLKMFYRNPVRQKAQIYGGYQNLQDTIKSMNIKAPQYIDLDEFLQFFSIKGSVTNVLHQIHDSNQTSQAEEQAHDERTKLLRKFRSLERLQISRRQRKPKRPVRQLTDFQEFNLTKKQKQTIREKKVKQMLKEKDDLQQKQLRRQFRANPIPADLNPERIKEQQKRMQMKRKKKLQEVAKRRQQDKELMSYLRANTRLFEPLNKETDEDKLEKQTEMYRTHVNKFTHKPVPWFVQEQMLEKIERQKSQRKKKLYEEAKVKYARSWNKLPDFFFKHTERQDSLSNSLIDEIEMRNRKQQNVVKASPVPDFKSLHKQFEEQLERKKKSFEPTRIQQFRLTSPKPDKRQVYSQYLSPQNKTPNNRWRQTLHSPPVNRISTTKKAEQWMEHNRRVQDEKKMAELQEKQKEKERVSKQKNFAKYMSKKLRQQQKQMPNLEAETAKKLRKHKQTVQYLQKMTERQLSQMYARVLQRPFLFESGTEDQKQYKKWDKGKSKKGVDKKKLMKRGVIKHIEAIDMSEGTTNKYRDSRGDDNGNNNYLSQKNNNYEEKVKQYGEHEVVNQSF